MSSDWLTQQSRSPGLHNHDPARSLPAVIICLFSSLADAQGALTSTPGEREGRTELDPILVLELPVHLFSQGHVPGLLYVERLTQGDEMLLNDCSQVTKFEASGPEQVIFRVEGAVSVPQQAKQLQIRDQLHSHVLGHCLLLSQQDLLPVLVHRVHNIPHGSLVLVFLSRPQHFHFSAIIHRLANASKLSTTGVGSRSHVVFKLVQSLSCSSLVLAVRTAKA